MIFFASLLASLNLPAALEDTTGQAIPQSLVAKAAAVQEQGGITIVNNMLRELPDLLTRNREILDEVVLNRILLEIFLDFHLFLVH